ncbi:MAG: acylneuraminate cytidylyltransferase [Anaerolineales bacterium]|jgi:N-acylneuraminate cytidylyltransferase
MVADQEVLAIIPARGGSKSIPRKNIRDFAGHPLIAYSIAAALQSAKVERTIVSTEDEEIAAIARQYGAETPFLRPAHLALDDTTDLPVFQHALEWLDENEGYKPELVIQLRPTSPVRPPDCVDQAIQILLADVDADSVRGVVPAGQNPYKMWHISDQGQLHPLLSEGFDEPYNMPRQELPATYWQTGHIDAIRTRTILEKGSMSGEVILPLLIDPQYTIDIDTDRDWQRAEHLIQELDLPFIRPGRLTRPFPQEVKMVVLDFDGVLTDNRVWVDKDGHEWVAANRGDGWGIARLKEVGVEVIVLSTETDPVVAARCDKLGIESVQGLNLKTEALEEIMTDKGIKPEHTVYLGNDVNDTACFALVACALVPSDAHHEAKRQADIHLSQRGGHGAVRELCDMILERRS